MDEEFSKKIYKYTLGIIELIHEKFKGGKLGGEVTKEMIMDSLFCDSQGEIKLVPEVVKPQSPIEEKVESPKDTPITTGGNSKKRKDCETNWAELVIVLKILYPEIKNKEDIINKIPLLKKDKRFVISDSETQIYNYIKDLKIRKEDEIEKYISNFPVDKFIGVKKAILSGKSFKDFQEIKDININPENGRPYGRKSVKSDIYLLYPDNSVRGISVKDSENATLTNYSIEGIFKNIGITHNFKGDRLSVLKEYFGSDYKYTKQQRPEANKLFYDKNNAYFISILESIENHKVDFTKELFFHVFPLLHYDVYGYNGTTLKDLNDLSKKIAGQKKEIKRNPKYETNTSAKLWFSIYLDGVEKWRFCIRGKTQIYAGSFQILEFTKVHAIS